MANTYNGHYGVANKRNLYGKHQHPGYQQRPNLQAESTGRNTGLGSFKDSNNSNGGFWCETCDRDFPTEEILSRHKQQHQKCNIDGCQFVAHPKVITKHIQMQHSSGLYKKIAKLQNPEDIQKWREERRKKYPTRINIEKKAAECKEKIDRGEKMALKTERHFNRDSKVQHGGVKRPHKFDKRHQNTKTNKPSYNQRPVTENCNNQKPHPKRIRKVVPIPCVVEKNKLQPFTGIISICMGDDTTEDIANISHDSNNFIEDDYYEEQVEQPTIVPSSEPVLCGALTSLLCDYGSSDEENDKNESNTHIKLAKEPQNNDNPKSDNQTVDNKNIIKPVNDLRNNVKYKLTNNLDKDLKVKETPQINEEENSDNESPEEVKTVKIEIDNKEPSSSKDFKTSRHVNVKKTVPFKKDHRHNYKHKIPSTLLQKLLQKEIRHERNIVLQCIRYIKKMNYFDKES